MGYKKNTLCWECKNFSKCSWSKGKPIDGWTAIPTIVKNGNEPDIKSFSVKSCPKFETDKISSYSYNDISKIIGKTPQYTAHLLNRKPYIVEDILKEKGFQLKRFNGERNWYLEKISPKESISEIQKRL